MAAVLVLAFIVTPLVELYVFFQVGGAIGFLPTIALLFAISVLGGTLVRREGGRAWQRLREAVTAGRLPGREVADGALVLVGGTLLLTPGFVTDALGLVLLLPLTRPVARRLVTRVAARRVTVHVGGGGPYDRPPASGRVVDAEVVDDDEPRP